MTAAVFSVNGETVRTYDPDRFLLSMFAPAACREDLWALYAFNHEIAKTREVVSDTKLGLIRLQWWRDAIEDIYAGGTAVPEHPVVEGLARAISAHGLQQDDFNTLIYAREFDLEDRLPANMAGLVNYADYTSTPLLNLTRRIVAPHNTADLRPLAVAWALTGILRATPVHLAQRRCYLPADLLPLVHRHFEGKELDKVAVAAGDVGGKAAEYLAASPSGLPKILRVQKKLTRLYLAQLSRAGHDVFSPLLKMPPAFREIRLAIA